MMRAVPHTLYTLTRLKMALAVEVLRSLIMWASSSTIRNQLTPCRTDDRARLEVRWCASSARWTSRFTWVRVMARRRRRRRRECGQN